MNLCNFDRKAAFYAQRRRIALKIVTFMSEFSFLMLPRIKFSFCALIFLNAFARDSIDEVHDRAWHGNVGKVFSRDSACVENLRQFSSREAATENHFVLQILIGIYGV